MFYVLVSPCPIHLFFKINSNKGAKILSNLDLGSQAVRCESLDLARQVPSSSVAVELHAEISHMKPGIEQVL